MSVSLTRPLRGALLLLSAGGYVGWLAGLGDRGDAQGIPHHAVTSLPVSVPARARDVTRSIVRNPFAGEPARPSAPHESVASGGSDASQPSVPNIDPQAAPSVVAAAPSIVQRLVVRATIVGPQPVAYVAQGDVMQIVRVGDTIAQRRVAAIDLRGIAFADGARLDLPATYAVTAAAPPARRAPRALTIDDLRRLLVPPPAANAAPSPAVHSVAMPAGSATPGPLPTVNTRGLPVGVNPTPDASGPTAYPYPYPYPPPAPH